MGNSPWTSTLVVVILAITCPCASCKGRVEDREPTVQDKVEPADEPPIDAASVVAYFAHSGPEDKPFPRLIMSALAPAQVGQTIRDAPFTVEGALYARLEVDVVGQILAFIRSAEPAEASGYGTFRLDLVEPARRTPLLLDCQAMRSVLALARDALPSGSATEAGIEALYNRLPEAS